eukprot:355094-Chlamydomonas_euryale.AAC.5
MHSACAPRMHYGGLRNSADHATTGGISVASLRPHTARRPPHLCLIVNMHFNGLCNRVNHCARAGGLCVAAVLVAHSRWRVRRHSAHGGQAGSLNASILLITCQQAV